MTSLHHFQRYSSKENVATNNTLQLISRIYSYSPIKAKRFLSKLLDLELNIGLDISQQKRESSSVPDGFICQQPIRLVIEAKQGTGLHEDQLIRHCDAFAANQQNILVALTKDEVNAADVEKYSAAIKAKGKDITFRAITYKDVCDAAADSVEDFEYDLVELVDDYESFCSEHKLLPVEERTMRVVPSGNSFDLNMRFGVYYDVASHGYSPHKFIGFYTSKSIRGVMEVEGVFDVTIKGGKIKSSTALKGKIDDFEEAILAMCTATLDEIGWNIEKGHRFFCSKSAYPTDYRKSSKFGIMGKRLVNLVDAGVTAKDAKGIAEQLSGKTWV